MNQKPRQKPRRLKTHSNAEKLITFLRKHQPATVTVTAIVRAGLMNSRDASGGLQYGIRHGAIEREMRPGATYSERVQYRLTGRPLGRPPMPAGDDPGAPSFDALLKAWGITPVRPPVPVRAPGRIVTFD